MAEIRYHRRSNNWNKTSPELQHYVLSIKWLTVHQGWTNTTIFMTRLLG